jgi:hypothetical protein
MLAVAILVSSTLSIDAGCTVQSFASYSTYTPTYYAAPAQVQVKKVVAVEYLAVPVALPVYAIGYAPAYVPTAPAMPAPAAIPQQTPCDIKLSETNARLAALEARLSVGGTLAPSTQPLPPPMTPVPPLPNDSGAAKSPFTLRCAGCHDASVAQAKGGKLTMFQNGLTLPIEPGIANKAIRAMMKGTMPKNGKLTDVEFTAILDELLQLSDKK